MEQLYYNGDLITMEGEGDYAEALLVADGRIKAVGRYDTVAAQMHKDCVRIDLHGKTLMPAFLDGHSHAASVAPMFADLCDLSACSCFDDIVAALTKYKNERQIPMGQPIVGCNYDEHFLAEYAHPDCDLLDRVSTVHPITILHVSVHIVVCNTMALEEVGYHADMADIPGGEIGRYDDGRLNGFLGDTANYPVIYRIFSALQQKMTQLWRITQQEYLSHGITTVQDGNGDDDTIRMMLALDRAGLVQVDVVLYESVNSEARQTMKTYAALYQRYQGHVKVGGYKLVLDGSPQARTAWMTQPYQDSTYCGRALFQDADVEAWVKAALDDNKQLLAHCNGDAASDQFLRSVENMLPLSDNPNKERLRFVMIHCQTVRKDQMARMARLKMIPSIFVSHVNIWGDVHIENLGRMRGSRVSPVKDALDAGLPYNFHTDTPVMKPDMLHAVWAAVNRVTRNGKVIGPEQRVSVYDALKGITIHTAYAYFEEDSKGSLKAGKRADLVVLSQNPLKVDPMTIKDIQVLATIKDGVCVYQSEFSH